MQIIINVSDFFFALPVNIVEKVVLPEMILHNEEGFFLNQIKINLLNAEEFFKIRINKNKPKKTLILFTLKNEVPVAILADDVVGFVRDSDLTCFQRGEFLKVFGFEYVTKFCLYNNVLMFFVDEDMVTKRVSELLWE